MIRKQHRRSLDAALHYQIQSAKLKADLGASRDDLADCIERLYELTENASHGKASLVTDYATRADLIKSVDSHPSVKVVSK